MPRNLHVSRAALLLLVLAALVLSGCGTSPRQQADKSPEAAASAPSPPTVTVTRTATPNSPRLSSAGTGHGAEEGLGHEGATVAPSTPKLAAPTYDLSGMDMPGFVTPSHNIGCLFDHYDGAHVRCDRRELDRAPAGKPADCQLDWGHAVELARGGRGRLACVGDTVLELHGQTDGSRVLQYGETARYRGIVCTSRETGLSCTSRAHGFTISRAAIRVF